MALYTLEAAKSCIRNRDGRRVFYLGPEDRLTDAARDYLREQDIALLPADQAKPACYRTLSGAVLAEKPEHMTHLHGNVLVPKDHPRIAFRGKIDALEAELLLAQKDAREERFPQVDRDLGEILDFVRGLIRCDVLDEPLPPPTLCGLDGAALRARSHNPAKFYGQTHFMPDASLPRTLLALNRVRTSVRETELACFAAFRDENGLPRRPDLLLGLNRLSSLLWILMIKMKGERYGS